MQNPFIPEILSILHNHPQGITAHEILKALTSYVEFSSLSNDGQLSLFQRHFMVMNALYQLQQSLATETRQILEISPLHIQLYPINSPTKSEQIAQATSPALSAYYLDWSNFKNTTEENVLALLDSFLRRYSTEDQRMAAYQTLELKPSATIIEVTRRYRELAARHHPDKGGDIETFIRIRKAYETLVSH